MDPGVRRDDADIWLQKIVSSVRGTKVLLRSLLLRIGKEQLLAIDSVAGDRGLAFRLGQPIDECPINCLSQS
jgi:hypothetical protein